MIVLIPGHFLRLTYILENFLMLKIKDTSIVADFTRIWLWLI